MGGVWNCGCEGEWVWLVGRMRACGRPAGRAGARSVCLTVRVMVRVRGMRAGMGARVLVL